MGSESNPKIASVAPRAAVAGQPERTQIVFDIISANDFFSEIEIAFNRLNTSKSKRVADLLFVILGLNHLREWIAPGFKDARKRRSPANDAERFFELIFDNDDWKNVNMICNQAKHNGSVPTLCVKYGLDVDDWECVDDVSNSDCGPPTGFTVDGQDIEPILERLSDFYRMNWFQRTPAP